MSFINRLKENEPIQQLYKVRHKETYVRSDKDYIIEERKHGGQDRLTLYAKGMRGFNICCILESKGWVQLDRNPSDIILQCKKCFEYDFSFNFYKYDLDKLEKTISEKELQHIKTENAL